MYILYSLSNSTYESTSSKSEANFEFSVNTNRPVGSLTLKEKDEKEEVEKGTCVIPVQLSSIDSNKPHKEAS